MGNLDLDFSDLELALHSGNYLIFEEDQRVLERIHETAYDEPTQTLDGVAMFEDGPVPYWQRERIRGANQIESGIGSRFIYSPPESSYMGTSLG
jgi:hypothetical protein